MAAIRRVGILTGGGDVPSLNVAIKAVAERAADHRIELLGLRRGWLSVLQINPDDENSFAAPMKVAPHEEAVTVTGPQFPYTFPADSLTILRLKTR